MLNQYNNTTVPPTDALGVDPRMLEMPVPFSWDAVVAATNDAFPNPFSYVGDFDMCPDLVPDDGSSQRCVSYHFSCAGVLETDPRRCSSYSLPPSPQGYDYPSPPYGPIDHASPHPTSPVVSSPNPSAASRVLVNAPCAGGIPVQQEGGYTCSSCNKFFLRRDDTKRHIDSAGKQVSCKYCGKIASGRRDSKKRHLDGNQACKKAWEAGHKAGRFTERTVEDAYN